MTAIAVMAVAVGLAAGVLLVVLAAVVTHDWTGGGRRG